MPRECQGRRDREGTFGRIGAGGDHPRQRQAWVTPRTSDTPDEYRATDLVIEVGALARYVMMPCALVVADYDVIPRFQVIEALRLAVAVGEVERRVRREPLILGLLDRLRLALLGLGQLALLRAAVIPGRWAGGEIFRGRIGGP